MYGAGNQEGSGFVGSQPMIPSNAIHCNPSQPSTPTLGM